MAKCRRCSAGVESHLLAIQSLPLCCCRYSLTPRGRVRLQHKLAQSASPAAAAAAEEQADGMSAGVARQLEALGDQHIGFRSLHCEDLGVTFVGESPPALLLLGRKAARGGATSLDRWRPPQLSSTHSPLL